MQRKVGRRLFRMVAVAAWLAGNGTQALADDKPPDKAVVDEILAVLHQRGDLDDADYQRLVAKNETEAAKASSPLLPKITLFGDLRQRMEGYFYRSDSISSRPNVFQGRYRARIGVQADPNDYVSAIIRVGTSQVTNGNADNRSQNISYGNTTDWAYGPIFVDLAYVDFHPFKANPIIPIENAKFDVFAGKMLNPFRWEATPDNMLFDPDITPEGAALSFSGSPLETLSLFVNAGYFVIKNNTGFTNPTPPSVVGTNGTSRDPNLVGVQAGTEARPIDPISVGWRGAFYSFNALDTPFFQRGEFPNFPGNPSVTNSGGNIALSGSGSRVYVGEGTLYFTWRGIEDWPATLWGKYAQNFSAGSIVTMTGNKVTKWQRPQNVAWSGGLEFGDKAKWARFGVGYYSIQADAFPSQFIDSDILDGETNRRAWIGYVTRQLFPNTDVRLWLSDMDPIRTSQPFDVSLSGSRRVRTQIDFLVSF